MNNPFGTLRDSLYDLSQSWRKIAGEKYSVSLRGSENYSRAMQLEDCADDLENLYHATADGEAVNLKLRTALLAIQADPSGCSFCDSGKLRNPSKGHREDCGFLLMERVLAQ